MSGEHKTHYSMDDLLTIMARLRDPDGGCPWDLRQDFRSIAPYTIEEAYEVADAITRNDMDDLRLELGDLLLQVVFHAQMAQEQQLFGFDDVVAGLCDKMIRRHPHVFGSADFADEQAVNANWEAEKQREKQAKGASAERLLLDDVTLGLPALTRAVKLQKKAASIGFDWDDCQQVLLKINEELQEVRDELAPKPDLDRVEDEIGDLFFAITNLARKLKIDPEQAARRANAKFERRFNFIERHLGGHDALLAASLDEMEQLWQLAKQKERA